MGWFVAQRIEASTEHPMKGALAPCAVSEYETKEEADKKASEGQGHVFMGQPSWRCLARVGLYSNMPGCS